MKQQMKLNYNGFIEHIADVLAAEDIETVQNEVWSIEVGIQLLNGYMEQLAKRAIETQDEFLIEWCKHICIIVEAENPSKDVQFGISEQLPEPPEV